MKTKFCTNCGKEIDEEAIICVGCGFEFRKVKPVDENPVNVFGFVGIAFSLLSFFFGVIALVVGLICSIVGLFVKKGSKTPAVIGLVISIVAIIFQFILFSYLFNGFDFM